jgi:hypothetical protein
VATYQYQNGYGDTFAFSVTAGIDPATGNLAIAINPRLTSRFAMSSQTTPTLWVR